MDIKNSEKVLYNGIKLPKVWPPRYKEPSECKEMPLPYIENKPESIGINIGRQLFVDDFLISKTDLKKVFHTPEYYKNNPVLKVDREWELTVEGYPYASPFSDGIWYDNEDNKFKMWYLAGAGTINKEKHSLCTCYAESEDGINWIKPLLDVVPGTNIVDQTNRDSATIWLDRNEKDSGKRFKMFSVEYKADYIQWQYVLKYSADGIHWSEGVAQSGAVSDRSTAFYNPFLEKWVLSMRHHNSVSWRSRAYLENIDPEEAVSLAHRLREGTTDKNVVYWFTPDDKEKRHEDYPEVDPGIYNFDAIAYESLMLGFYSQWQGPENNICREAMMPKRNEIQLGYSRDGFHFARPTHESFMPVCTDSDESWNYGNMQSVNGVPLVVDDKLYFYSSGRNKNGIWWDSGTSCGMAVLRRDGFCSLHADNKGEVITEKLDFDGKYLFINADVKGSIKVEVLDEDGNAIKGYDALSCMPMSGDSTKYYISWAEKKDLSEIKNQRIRLRFIVEKGDLYSFWISPWESGESRGMLPGGGPDISPTGIDVPLK